MGKKDNKNLVISPLITRIPLVGAKISFNELKTVKKRIQGYFTHCEDNNLHLTMTGLALALGTNRDKLGRVVKDKKVKEDVRRAIKIAKVWIEHYLEQLLLSRDKPAGIIFNLKNNYGWKDLFEHDISGLAQTLQIGVVMEGGKTTRKLGLTVKTTNKQVEKCKDETVPSVPEDDKDTVKQVQVIDIK